MFARAGKLAVRVIRERMITPSPQKPLGLKTDRPGPYRRIEEGSSKDVVQADYSQRDYLRWNLGDKIDQIDVSNDGRVTLLVLSLEAKNSDLAYLRELDSLQRLDLRETRVSYYGRAGRELKERLPQLEIKY